MGDIDDLDWLQGWYLGQCDGNWEHGNRLLIDTIDNPGWSVRIDLRDTRYGGLNHEQMKLDQGDNDWIICWIENKTFHGTGDPTKLKRILAFFREWIEAASMHK